MPTPIVSIVTAAVIAAGGVGVGNALLGSGGTSQQAAVRVPALAADPLGRPSHHQFTYTAPGSQSRLPPLGDAPGQILSGPAPTPGSGYTPKGQPRAPLDRVPSAAATKAATTWPLYLSGSDLLQPDQGAAVGTDQSVGPVLGGACGMGLAGRWTAPTTSAFGFHGPVPGVLHIAASGPAALTISFITSKYGGTCVVQSSTDVTVSGTQTLNFTLPRVDVDVPEGYNVSLVVATTSGAARVISSHDAPSYIVAPTAPQ